MMRGFIVTGTDTDVGKTVFAAALAGHLGARYWKPVQAGLGDETDRNTVRRLSAGRAEVLPEAYRLTTPCSPHEAARIDGIQIDPTRLVLPAGKAPLVVEGAGGALVPLNNELLAVDLFASWALPVILVARTVLGTINHSLMTIEVMRSRGIEVAGIVFSGEQNAATESAIVQFGKCRHLGRLPHLDPLTPESLANAFARHVHASCFV